MLSEIFPKKSPRIVALSVLGQVADDYDTWLSQQGYGKSARCGHAAALVRIDRDLRRPRAPTVAERSAGRSRSLLEAISASRSLPERRRLLRFAQERSLLPAPPPAVTRRRAR
jgi:hypothetical protein